MSFINQYIDTQYYQYYSIPVDYLTIKGSYTADWVKVFPDGFVDPDHIKWILQNGYFDNLPIPLIRQELYQLAVRANSDVVEIARQLGVKRLVCAIQLKGFDDKKEVEYNLEKVNVDKSKDIVFLKSIPDADFCREHGIHVLDEALKVARIDRLKRSLFTDLDLYSINGWFSIPV